MTNLYNLLPPSVWGTAALIGTYCLILTYQKKHEIEKILTRGIKTVGTVTEIHQDSLGNTGEAPIVEYDTPHGSKFKHISTTYTMPCAYKVGQEVDIWYYHHKSIHLAALADDKPNEKRIKTLLYCGIVLCLLTYPFIIGRLASSGLL